MVRFIKRKFVLFFMRNGLIGLIGASLLSACHRNTIIRWDAVDRETFFAYDVGFLDDMSNMPLHDRNYPGGVSEYVIKSYEFERNGEPVRDFYKATFLMDSEGFIVEHSLAVDFDLDGFDEYTLVSRFSGEILPGHRQPFEVIVKGKIGKDSNLIYEGSLGVVDMSSGQRVGSADIYEGRLVNEEDYVHELGIPIDGFNLGMSLAKEELSK